MFTLCIITPKEHIEITRDIAYEWAQSLGLTDSRESLMSTPLNFQGYGTPSHYFCCMEQPKEFTESVVTKVVQESNNHSFIATHLLTLEDSLLDLKTKFCCVYSLKEDFLERVGLTEIK